MSLNSAASFFLGLFQRSTGKRFANPNPTCSHKHGNVCCLLSSNTCWFTQTTRTKSWGDTSQNKNTQFNQIRHVILDFNLPCQVCYSLGWPVLTAAWVERPRRNTLQKMINPIKVSKTWFITIRASQIPGWKSEPERSWIDFERAKLLSCEAVGFLLGCWCRCMAKTNPRGWCSTVAPATVSFTWNVPTR